MFLADSPRRIYSRMYANTGCIRLSDPPSWFHNNRQVRGIMMSVLHVYLLVTSGPNNRFRINLVVKNVIKPIQQLYHLFSYHQQHCHVFGVIIDGVLDCWLDLLDSLIQRVTTLYSSLLHIHTSLYSHVFNSRCLVAASNGGRSPSSGFPNYPRPQLQASNSNSEQLNFSSFLTLS
jgi:hypothetical protein